MSEPLVTTLGVKYGTLLAGILGGVVSLAHVRELTRMQMVLAVLSGAGCAAYLTPIGMHVLGAWLATPIVPAFENAAAFLLGIAGMNIVPGVVTLSGRFKSNPHSFLRKE